MGKCTQREVGWRRKYGEDVEDQEEEEEEKIMG